MTALFAPMSSSFLSMPSACARVRGAREYASPVRSAYSVMLGVTTSAWAQRERHFSGISSAMPL